ncbi:hypothetical protein N2152v2_005201 [Parachlorella kessleri]
MHDMLQPRQLASELVALSGQQPLLGLLLWRSLVLNLVTADEVLRLTSSSQLLTAALLDLHEVLQEAGHGAAWDCAGASEGATCPTQLASQAFSALVKLIVTGGQAECAKHSVASVMATLRATWCASAAAGTAGAAPGGSEGLGCRETAVGPPTGRQAGGPLLLARLARAVHMDVFPRQLARRWLEFELAAVLQGSCQALPGWPEAMAAVAAALPLEALLVQVQRAMLVSPDSSGTSDAAQGGGKLGQQQLLLQNLVCGEEPRQQPGTAPGTRGAAAAAGSEAAQQQHRELPFVVQAVLMPMLPEEEDLVALEAQAAALAELGQLPATLLRLVQEYSTAAQQRARALHYQAQGQQQQQHGQHGQVAGTMPDGQPNTAGLGAGSGPNLAKGQQEVAALLGEFRAQVGRLTAATVQGLAARYGNAFMHAYLEQQVVPALLQPTADAAALEERGALLQYLHIALPAQPAKLRARFSPDAVGAFRQHCLLAQLESASLEQLLGEAVAKPWEAGAVGPHQILDRMEALVGERLCTLAGNPATAATPGAALQVHSLLETLLNAFNTAYLASLAAPSAAGHAGCAVALAAHLAGMIHSHRQLHVPLLRRVEQLVLVAGPDGQLDPQQAGCQDAAFAVALLSCLRHFHAFCTLQPLRQAPNSSSCSNGAVGPAVTGTSGAEGEQRLLVKPRAALPGAKEGWYGGEWLRRLAFPLCPEAMQLLQWMQVRLSVAELLQGDASRTAGPACQPGGTSALSAGEQQGQRGAAREAEQGLPRKRARLNPEPGNSFCCGSGAGASSSRHTLNDGGLMQQVQELCQGVVAGELGRSLTHETGKLRLTDYLRWEAATHGAQSDLIPLSGRGCVVRLVCGEYLRLTFQSGHQQGDGRQDATSGRQQPQQRQTRQQQPTGIGPRQWEAPPGAQQLSSNLPLRNGTADAESVGTLAAQLLLPLLTVATGGGQLGARNDTDRAGEGAQGTPQATWMDVELQHRGSPEAATQKYVSDSSQEIEVLGGNGTREKAAAVTAGAVHRNGSHESGWPSKAGICGNISNFQIAEAMACEIAAVLLDACSSSTRADDYKSQLPGRDLLASARVGASAGQHGRAVSEQRLLEVVQTACAYMLRLLAQHGKPACEVQATTEGLLLGASSADLLARFLQCLVRSCQEGLPAFAAPAEPTAGAAGATTDPTGSSAHSARLEAPAALLAFKQQDIVELGELVAALAKQLCMELLLLPPPLLGGAPVLHVMPGLADVARVTHFTAFPFVPSTTR